MAADTTSASVMPSLAEEARTPERSKAELRKLYVILGALMLAMFLAALDQTIVATALPTIAGDLHGLNHLSWVVTSYLLTTTITVPLWGKLGDLYGRKFFFQSAILIFLIGSILSGLSQNMSQLIAFRALQGIGAGGLVVGTQAIMGEIVSPRERARYLGIFGATYGLASVAGPLLGGLFTQRLSWRWIFYVNVPLGIVAMILIASTLQIARRRLAHKIDFLGTTFLGIAVTALILLTSWGGTTYPWNSRPIWILGAVSVVFVAMFAYVEPRVAEPLIPIVLFKSKVFNLASILGFLIGLVMFGSLIYVPLYLQTVHGASPTASGLEMLPVIIGVVVSTNFSGQLSSRLGRYKVFPIVGFMFTVLGLLGLATLEVSTSYLIMSIYMLSVGIGIGGVTQILVVAVMNASPEEHLGAATSGANFFRSIGGSFGVAIFGALLNSRLFSDLAVYLPHGVLKSLHTVSGGSIASNPAQLGALPGPIHHGFVEAFGHSLTFVFLVAAPIAALGFVLCWWLPEVPIKDQERAPAGPEEPSLPPGSVPATNPQPVRTG